VDVEEVMARLAAQGAERGGLVGLAVAPGVGVGLATARGAIAVDPTATDPIDVIHALEAELRPRWVLWSQTTAQDLVAADLRVATAWDLAAVHRLLFGGWRADPGLIWARLHDLPTSEIPTLGPVDLFSQHDDEEDHASDDPVRGDGHLRAGWTGGGWADTPERLARWAELAVSAADTQHDRLAAITERPAALRTARAESTAELLCAELTADGLPIDRGEAEALVAAYVGPRPRTEAEAAAQRQRRDADVLRHVPVGGTFDLRSPGQVRSLLRFVGIEVPDTRAWRLEQLRDAHPVVDALLTWRKAERVATTYGYGWLDEHVAPDGRLRGEWSGADGAAGRMTASAGLHNLPADLRPAVLAEPRHVFVRADLGQIEPRVLAAVSGDDALARATQDDDLYLPVAGQLGVDRATAKVAVLGTMYGQTTGHGAQLLPRLRASYPVAMAMLDDADRAGQAGHELRTHGGRLIRFGSVGDDGSDERAARGRAAARGRYGRNALIQGAAAELFKVWAVTVRARLSEIDDRARIVLCLHDELLVHAPETAGPEVAALLERCLQEAARRWSPGTPVRFVAEISVIARWSDAKD
jgi:DNA polymerase-1